MLLFLVLRADHSSAHRLALDLAVETGRLFVRVELSFCSFCRCSKASDTLREQLLPKASDS